MNVKSWIWKMILKIARPAITFPVRLFHAVEYEGLEHIPPSGPVILAGNHPSFLDPLLIGLGVRRPVRFLAWHGLFKIPGLRWILRWSHSIPVAPGRGARALSQAIARLRRGEVIGIFPEGGRSRSPLMQSPKRGVAILAQESRAPVIPFVIQGMQRVWPRGRLLPRPGKIRIKFLGPLMESGTTLLERLSHNINAHLSCQPPNVLEES